MEAEIAICDDPQKGAPEFDATFYNFSTMLNQ
jgi:hypothetical protein